MSHPESSIHPYPEGCTYDHYVSPNPCTSREAKATYKAWLRAREEQGLTAADIQRRVVEEERQRVQEQKARQEQQKRDRVEKTQQTRRHKEAEARAQRQAQLKLFHEGSKSFDDIADRVSASQTRLSRYFTPSTPRHQPARVHSVVVNHQPTDQDVSPLPPPVVVACSLSSLASVLPGPTPPPPQDGLVASLKGPVYDIDDILTSSPSLSPFVESYFALGRAEWSQVSVVDLTDDDLSYDPKHYQSTLPPASSSSRDGPEDLGPPSSDPLLLDLESIDDAVFEDAWQGFINQRTNRHKPYNCRRLCG
ncbi:hypothetical protein H2198_008919 [Neophaeococcomyces mojaviensis]|uniref:Uncharacterized protein n=1 Tax=Neophaeococcomyces mojaviensis TaxID=3383035 RepID=A0ACC2ZWB6_9EURO|nr:hypothetical protein H2198_008919 [Knufia sp. JES_112]